MQIKNQDVRARKQKKSRKLFMDGNVLKYLVKIFSGWRIKLLSWFLIRIIYTKEI
jgi:hypothetical protein